MAQELLSELHARGIRLRLADGQLDVLAPSGALTPELRERLRVGRDELVALLRRTRLDADPRPLATHPEGRHEPFALTDLQHAYWVGRGSAVELGGVSCHYYFELEREYLCPQRLAESLQKVIARHDMLRTVVGPDGRQRVLPGVPAYAMPVADLRDLPADEKAAQLAHTRAEMDHQVLPADRWPLFDIRASRLDDRRLRLHVSLDVLILDGSSLYLIFDEWRRFYEEPDWTPQPLSLSYRDYVLHEETAREGEQFKRDEAYWVDRLDTLPAPPGLPLAKQPGQIARPRFTRRQARLPRDLWAAIKKGAHGRGLTPSAVLMAAFADVLRLWCSQSSFTLNLTLFNRPQLHPQINSIVGDFTSVTLLEVTEQHDDTFVARTRRLQEQLLKDLEHLSYSGVRVLRERSRRLGGGPGAAMPIVFTSALVLASSERDPGEGIRFFGEQMYSVSQTPQVWLDHQVAEEDGDLVSNWDAVEELFPSGLLDDMFATYRAVLGRLSGDDEAWSQVGRPVALPAWQVVERLCSNDTAAQIPAATLSELVERQARKRPDAVAVIDEHGQMSYLDAVRHSRRLARRLLALGAMPNTLVSVVLDKGWQQVAAVLGVCQSGAAYLPIDPQWPAARRRDLLDQGAVRVVVTSPRLRAELTWPADVHLVTIGDPEVRDAYDGPLAVVASPEDLAYVIFTSGSTGQPKGVMIDHRGAANTIQDMNRRFQVGSTDRVLSLSALSFDLSVYDIFGVLAAGGTVVMPAPSGVHEPAHWNDLVVRHGVTIWNSVPALMQVWLDSHTAGPLPGSTLRLALLSGDWIPVGLPDAVRRDQPGVEVISLGGATEASIWSVCYPIGQVPPDWSRIPYGRPLANQTMHVLTERLEPCPVWTAGEIYIGGTGVARGYWADTARTQERFIVHPGTHERLYRTGDLGRYLPGGDIEFLGRQDSQVKINGYRIELGEITAALLHQPGVAEAVVGVDTNPATARRHLVAHVVPAANRSGEPAAPEDAAGWQTDGWQTDGWQTDGWQADGWQAVIAAGEAELGQVASDLAPALAAYRDEWWAMERLCPSIMARTLAELGVFCAPGDTATAKEIVARGRVKPLYGGLVEQWLGVLASEGMLRATGRQGEYRCERGLDAGQLDGAVRQGLAALQVGNSQAALMQYVAICADNQVALLRGEVSPLQLLMPGGDSGVTEELYATNPVSHMQNRIAARVVSSYVDARSKDRPLVALEVGAGTGATSTLVLPQLNTSAVTYWFTDISTYFTGRAKTRFRAYPFVNYRVFDIDREPAAQGFGPGTVDIVIAANVMHDAKDLDRSLAHLRSVLTPGGLLLLIEGTANSLVQMITVGFIEGLAHDRGAQRLPLLPVPQWRERIEAVGFPRFASIPDGPPAVDAHVQHVLLGLAPGDRAGLDGPQLRRALERTLPEYLVPRHILLVDRLPLTANGKVDRSALPSPWHETEAAEQVAPRDETEKLLLAIWRDALERDDFGVEDNFFELGGDSLHAVNILGRIRDEFGMEANAEEGMELLFDNPTIAELAAALAQESEAVGA
jgi:L-cysteine---[L-cysteinyl-carrier protein] ligase PchF